MKKIIVLLVAMATIIACSSKKENKPTEKNTYEVPTNITMVQANGRVIPLNGMIDIASEISGIVEKVNVKVGDVVSKGDVLITLEHDKLALEVKKAKANIEEQKANIKAAEATLRKSEMDFTMQSEMYEISKDLVKAGAESKQNVRNFKEKVLLAKQAVEVNRSMLEVEKQRLNALVEEATIASKNLDNASIKADDDGQVLDIDINKGTAIQAFQTIGTFAPDQPVVVEAEVDELFANRVSKGDEVDVHLVGYNNVKAKGYVYDVLEYMSDKSIFSGLNIEQQDRQVRKIKVMLYEQKEHPLLGTKVVCNIYIK